MADVQSPELQAVNPGGCRHAVIDRADGGAGGRKAAGKRVGFQREIPIDRQPAQCADQCFAATQRARSTACPKTPCGSHADALEELSSALTTPRPGPMGLLEQTQALACSDLTVSLLERPPEELRQRSPGLRGLLPQAVELRIGESDLGAVHMPMCSYITACAAASIPTHRRSSSSSSMMYGGIA